MLRSASGPSASLFCGIGKSPVTIDTARPWPSSMARAARTSSAAEWVPSCEARMQRAW